MKSHYSMKKIYDIPKGIEIQQQHRQHKRRNEWAHIQIINKFLEKFFCPFIIPHTCK